MKTNKTYQGINDDAGHWSYVNKMINNGFRCKKCGRICAMMDEGSICGSPLCSESVK